MRKVPENNSLKTNAYNELSVADRLEVLDYLSNAENALVDKVRGEAVRKFWTHEQELLKNVQCTREWTPDQIEEIMNISEITGRASINGDVPHDINGKSYYGHHMMNVADHPEYAGDWRNIQALDYNEHSY